MRVENFVLSEKTSLGAIHPDSGIALRMLQLVKARASSRSPVSRKIAFFIGRNFENVKKQVFYIPTRCGEANESSVQRAVKTQIFIRSRCEKTGSILPFLSLSIG